MLFLTHRTTWLILPLNPMRHLEPPLRLAFDFATTVFTNETYFKTSSCSVREIEMDIVKEHGSRPPPSYRIRNDVA